MPWGCSWLSSVFTTALFEALVQGPASPEELAARTGTNVGYVRCWCEAAFAFGLLELTPANYALTELAYQNLSEHVQGNHFLRPAEIEAAMHAAGLTPKTFLFAEGTETVVVGTRSS